MICRERGRREAALPAAAEGPGESAGPEHLPKTKGNEKMNDRANQLLRICLALTSERDREKFLCMVLDAAMKVAHCDAGTLYLLENDALTFVRMVTISQNMRRGCGGDPITLPPVPMKSQYVCAKAAMDGIMVNIPNVREVKGFDFSGALEYDRITGYRTQSMLVMPMTDIKGRVIGVMQLINAMDGDNVVPFSKDIEQLIGAVSSQAAACILNMQYARQINALLESLVDTMTKAIQYGKIRGAIPGLGGDKSSGMELVKRAPAGISPERETARYRENRHPAGCDGQIGQARGENGTDRRTVPAHGSAGSYRVSGRKYDGSRIYRKCPGKKR